MASTRRTTQSLAQQNGTKLSKTDRLLGSKASANGSLDEVRNQVAASAGRLVSTLACDIKKRAPNWVWMDQDAKGKDAGRTPCGAFSLSAGAGGSCKSMFECWRAAKISRGALPGIWFGTPKMVYWATMEASPEVEVAPRLEAAGADMSMIRFIKIKVDDGDYSDHIKIFDPELVEQLDELVAADGNVGEIVLDPALDVLPGKINNHEQAEVRDAIGRWNAFAEKWNLLISGIAHFNKMTSVDDALMRITGSAAWSQRPRSALVFAYDAENEVFVLSQGKNNWGRTHDLPNRAFIVKTVPVQMDDGTMEPTPYLDWVDHSEDNVDSILARRKKGGPSKREQAVQFIKDTLRNGEMEKKKYIKKADEEQISQSTREWAERELGVVSTKMPARTGKQGNPGVMVSLPEGNSEEATYADF